MTHDNTTTTTATAATTATSSAGSASRGPGVLRGRCPGTTRWRPAGQGELAPSGTRARVAANLAALEVLGELEVTGQAPSEAQRRALARWSGWGAVPAVFDVADDRFAGAREHLHTLLDNAQFAAAARSTLNAHYTDLGIVAAVWDAVAALGFDGGEVLEPGCGAGNFLHHAPTTARVTAVELDPTTARVAAALHPEVAVRCESFADTPLAEGSMDLAIGNVPFAAVKLHDRHHNPGARLSIHDHFVVKALHLLRPGGLVAVLTSRYTLDARSPVARRQIAALADLVGAVRLPSGAHEKAAGTDAVSDLLILRRRDSDLADPAETVRADGFDATAAAPGYEQVPAVQVNRYFVEHPDRVLGEFALRHGAYSAQSLRVEPHPGELDVALRAALAGIVADARATGLTLTPASGVAASGVVRSAAGTARTSRPTTTPGQPGRLLSSTAVRPFSASSAGRAPTPAPAVCEGLLAVDGEGGFTRIVAGAVTPFEVPAAQAGELRALLGLRDTVVALLEHEATERDETPAMRGLRGELTARYEAYLDAFGPLSRYTLRPTGRVDPVTGEPRQARVLPRHGGFRADPHAASVYALESGYDPAAGAAARASLVRADIFTRRVIAPRTRRVAAESPADALAICLDEHARVDLPVIAGLLEVDPDTARARLAGLVFTDPDTSALIPAAEYLSGNVRAKLAAAEAAVALDPAMAVNVAALREVIPVDLSPAEISAHLGAAWIDAGYVQGFLREVCEDTSASVEHPGGAVWEVHGARYGVAATQTWGTARRPAFELVAALCEQRPVRVTDTVTDPDGAKREVLNVSETLAAQDKARELGERFAAWVWEDPQRAETLARVYNDTFNAIVLRSYDGAGPDTMALPGLAEGFTPRAHQYAAVARMIAEPGVLLAHEVGAGKTAEMAIGAMELRRLGLARKPAIVVPNHQLAQWAHDFASLYPRARLLIATRADLATAAARREFVARAATGDWDTVLMTHSAFLRLPMSLEAQRAYLDREAEEMTRWLAALTAGGERERPSVKRVQRMLLAAQERIKAKLDSAADTGVSFEQTGIDYLCADEAHLFKNLRTPSNIAGAAIDGSQRAQDLDMKLWWLRSQRGARVVTLATATPIANSITETWVMQRYTRPDLLDNAGITTFDQWAATFGRVVTTVEMTPDATGFRLTDRFARFTNVPELLRLWHVSADIKTAADLDLPVPALAPRPEDGTRAPRTVLITASPALRAFVTTLGERAERIRAKAVHPSEDNMLKVCSEGRAAALDLRLLGREQPGPAPVDHAAATITRIWRAHRSDRFTRPDGTPHPTPGALQIVFCDLGTPSDTKWDAYTTLRDRLVARGMPREAVRFIHEASTDAAKAALFAAARSGEVAVLIGSTEKMGVGTNVQARAIALHHLGCPWRPADVHQREGRIVRQGNPYPEVEIYRYITEGSFDGYSWQTVARKSAFIDQVMHGTLDVREIEDIGEATLSFDEVKALASGDPRIIEKAKLDAEVATLDRLERAHHAAQARLGFTVKRAESILAGLDAEVAGIDAALARRRPTRGEAFHAELDGQRYTERAAYSADLAHGVLAAAGTRVFGRAGSLGSLGGLPVSYTLHRDRSGDPVVDLEFADAPGDPVTVTPATLDPRPLGLVASLERRHAGLEGRRHAQATAETTRREHDRALAQLGAPFARAAELAGKRARADELREAMTDLARTAENATPATDDPADPGSDEGHQAEAA